MKTIEREQAIPLVRQLHPDPVDHTASQERFMLRVSWIVEDNSTWIGIQGQEVPFFQIRVCD